MFAKIFSQSSLLILAQWLIIRLVLEWGGVNAAGDYFFVLSLLAPVFMLLGASFKNYASLEHYGPWNRLLGTRAMSLGLVSAAGLAVMAIRPPVLVLLVLLVKVVEFALDTVQALEIRRESIAWCTAGAFLFAAGVGGLFVYEQVTGDLALIGLIGVAAVAAVFALVGTVALTRTEGETPPIILDSTLLWRLVADIGFPAFLVSITASIPRFAVERFEGSAALGVFGSFLYFYLVSHIVTVSMFQAGIGRLKRGLGAKQEFRRVLGSMAAMLGILGMVGLTAAMTLSEVLVTVIFGSELTPFHTSLPVFAGFIVIGSFATLLEQLFVFLGLNRILRRLAVMSLAAALIVCPALTWYFGMWGTVGYMYLLFSVKAGTLLIVYRRLPDAELVV